MSARPSELRGRRGHRGSGTTQAIFLGRGLPRSLRHAGSDSVGVPAQSFLRRKRSALERAFAPRWTSISLLHRCNLLKSVFAFEPGHPWWRAPPSIGLPVPRLRLGRNLAGANGRLPASLPHPDRADLSRWAGQLRFIIAVNGQGLWIVISTWAHERVLFEQHLKHAAPEKWSRNGC